MVDPPLFRSDARWYVVEGLQDEQRHPADQRAANDRPDVRRRGAEGLSDDGPDRRGGARHVREITGSAVRAALDLIHPPHFGTPGHPC